MAQQLILWNADKNAAEPLEKLVTAIGKPEVRLQALCTLDGLGLLRPDVVASAMKDEHAGVRAQRSKPRHRLIRG